MSDSPRPAPRPIRVTFASVLGTAGCAVLVASLFDTMARLSGTDAREEVADALAEPPFRGSGVSVDQVLAVLRGLGYTAGALAAAGAVLAVFVALRHRGARIGFTVVAALLLLTMPTTGLLPVLPAVAAGLLWRRDARDWFAGRTPAPLSSAARTPSAPQTPQDRPQDRPQDQPPRQPWTQLPSPQDPAAQQTPAPPAAPSPYAVPPAQSPTQAPAQAPTQAPWPAQPPAQADWTRQLEQQPAWPLQAGPGPRPGTVTTAAVLALVGSGLGLLVGGSVLAALAVTPDAVEEAIAKEGQLERFDVAVEQVVAMLWGTGAVLVLWSLVSAVLAVLVLRRSPAARILLAVSAGMAAVLSLVAILSGISVVTLVLGGATVVLLFSRGANAWFAGRPPPDRGSGPRVSGSGPPW